MNSQFSDPEMQEIFEGFLVETQELLDNVSQDLMILENQPEDLDLLNRIFRSFHTIKGTSGFMGFDAITTITHHAEDLLNKLRRIELKVSLPIIDVLLEVHDWIVTLMDKLQSGDKQPVDFAGTIKQLKKLNAGEALDGDDEEATDAPEEQAIRPEDDTPPLTDALSAVTDNPEMVQGADDFSNDELDLIQAAFDELNQKFVEENKPKPKAKKEATAKTQAAAEPASQAEANKSEPPAAEPKTKTKPKAKIIKPGNMKMASETIRVDVNRVEALMDLSGELVLGRNRLAQITEILEHEFEHKDEIRDLIENTAQIDFVTSEIQAAIMRMRMVPIGKLYQKAPRIVRDLSKEFKKKIKLIVKGEETEIDRGIIEELNDPLVHMIRNSCDHGIESPEKRKELGKPEEGILTLDADQEGNNIVLRISDDGAGMDPENLKAKALEKGLINEEQASQMTSREAFQLIFTPGFSTAKTVSNVSGRGVGMDVVRTNIQHLKGMIEIESELQAGSTFIIKLPLTLAIIQGLLVKVHNESYAIPLSSVEEVVSIDPESVYTVNQQEVIRIRSEVYPLLRLDKAVGVEVVKEDLVDRNAVIVGLGIQRVGVVVDELLGQQEIVIKSLGEYLGNVSGIAGSTILGDGRVIMIIDVADLLKTVFNNNFM